MDFAKYGQGCMENDGVTETEFGLLRRLAPPFPEPRQGQRMMQAKAARSIWIKPLDEQINRKLSNVEVKRLVRLYRQ